MQILITGSAGFIGYHLSKALAAKGYEIYGIDSLNSYYNVNLKTERLRQCGILTEGKAESVSVKYPNYKFRQVDLCDKPGLENIFEQNHFDVIINLAAQAGVRYSLENPDAYVDSNVSGFLHLLELARHYECPRIIYASSSSVYGNSNTVPFREDDRVDHPVSIYAATKKANELMAFTYSWLYKIQTIGLRFFTVYGPWGRPDMAPLLFARAIQSGTPIKVFNNGDLSRDFTYIDDIIEGIVKITERKELVREDTPGVPAVLYNIGHGSPVKLMDFISLLEQNLGCTARKEFVGMQPGDVFQTWADTSKLNEDYGYVPATSLEEGIRQFAKWYKSFQMSL